MSWKNAVFVLSYAHLDVVVVKGGAVVPEECEKPTTPSILNVHPISLIFVCFLIDANVCPDAEGIHHVTFPSPLEVPPPTPCHGVMKFFEDGRIIIEGAGAVPSVTLSRARIHDGK